MLCNNINILYNENRFLFRVHWSFYAEGHSEWPWTMGALDHCNCSSECFLDIIPRELGLKKHIITTTTYQLMSFAFSLEFIAIFQQKCSINVTE